ncbi:MAG: antitoxin [Dehalococcoidia bacterium]
MPTLHVRDVPSDLYDELRQHAAAQGRSLSADVIKLLEMALRQRTYIDPLILDRIEQRRRELGAQYGQFPSSVDDIRADRER